MNDLQKYIDSHDGRLSVHLNPDSDGTLILGASTPTPNRGKGNRSGAVIYVPTFQLLAMIDAADPDAMRGYLRERSDYLDGPHDGAHVSSARIRTTPMTAEEIADAVPEADSPEDVDEYPEATSRLYALHQVAAILPHDALVEDLLTAAEWVHSGSGLATIEDRNMAGEVIS